MAAEGDLNKVDGDILFDGDITAIINLTGTLFQDTAQMIFNADYIGFDSRLHNTGVPNLKNLLYSTFTADDADTNFGFVYDSTNDLYIAPDLGDNEYVIIEADDASISWANNNTKLVKISSGKWVLYGTTGTAAVQRAQVHKSLWYGTTGSDQLILDFTNVTAMKTTHANDVGKRGHYANMNYTNQDTNPAALFTGTFADTSTNSNCASWSKINLVLISGGYARWEIASGTVRNNVTSSTTSDELGTDTSGDEINNPANCQIDSNSDNSLDDLILDVIVLCSGDITWVAGGDTSGVNTSDIDFFTTHSIPDFTAAGSISSEGTDTSTLIFKNTVASTDNAIAVINSTIDATSSEQRSISADGGSNFTNVNNAEITRLTAGTALWRKIVITRTDLSKEDIVTEQAIKFEFY